MAANRLKSWSSGPNTSEGRRITAPGKLLAARPPRPPPWCARSWPSTAPVGADAPRRAPGSWRRPRAAASATRAGARHVHGLEGLPPRLGENADQVHHGLARLAPRGARCRDSAGWPARHGSGRPRPIGCRCPARSGRRTAARTRQPVGRQRPHGMPADEAGAAEHRHQASLLQPRGHCLAVSRAPVEASNSARGGRCEARRPGLNPAPGHPCRSSCAPWRSSRAPALRRWRGPRPGRPRRRAASPRRRRCARSRPGSRGP